MTHLTRAKQKEAVKQPNRESIAYADSLKQFK
jgi:hypothetical protein